MKTTESPSRKGINIVFNVGGKGGVGKSFVTRLLASFASLHGQYHLVDADDENATLKRFFPEAEQINVRSKHSIDLLVQRAEELAKVKPGCLIIVDSKAGTKEEMLSWFADVPFDLLAEQNIRFTALGVLNSPPDATTTVLNWARELGNKVSYIIALNHKDGKAGQHLTDTKEGKAFLERLSPQIINIPKLDESYANELETLGVTISDALISEKPLSFLTHTMSRGRLRNFQNRVFEEFSRVSSSLFPE